MSKKNESPIASHQSDYKPEIWKNYSLQELGIWVHLFHKRALHRLNKEKATKDLHDAKNYLWMIEQNLKARATELDINYGDL